MAIWSILYYHIRTNQCTATANWSITHKPPFGYGSKVGTPRIRWLIPNIASESFAWRMWQIKNLPLTWRKTGVSFGWLHFAVSSVQRRATAPGSRHILTWQGGGPMMSSSLPWILASLCLIGTWRLAHFISAFWWNSTKKILARLCFDWKSKNARWLVTLTMVVTAGIDPRERYPLDGRRVVTAHKEEILNNDNG